MSKARIPRDAFVAKVKKAAGHDDPVVKVEGFVGDSPADGYFRLYADPSLNMHIDIPESDVIHYEKMSSEESPLGGAAIWLNKDAVFATGDVEAKNRPQQKFLAGDLAEKLDTGLVGYTPISWYAGCNSGWHTCRSHFYTECFQSRFFRCDWTGTIVLTDRITTRASLVDGCASALACPWTDRLRETVVQVNPQETRRFNDAGFGRFNP